MASIVVWMFVESEPRTVSGVEGCAGEEDGHLGVDVGRPVPMTAWMG
jgi:hypothetical protein